jgi:hypothetical protein
MIRDGIKVTVSETARVNLQLPVGGRTEDVTVVGEARSSRRRTPRWAS